jgi:vacuolar-type H+-ATPase subunit I/STV1
MGSDGIDFAETSNPLLAEDQQEERSSQTSSIEGVRQSESNRLTESEISPAEMSTGQKLAQESTESIPVEDDAAYAAWLKQQPLEKVFQLHPGLTGKLGELSQKQVAAARQAWEREQSERGKKLAERRLAEENPTEFARRKLAEDDAREVAQRIGSNLAYAVEGRSRQTVQSVAQNLARLLPGEAVRSVAGKTYEGDYGTAMTAWFRDVYNAGIERAVAAERARWERDARPALRKEALGNFHAYTPSPDLGAGLPPQGVRQVTSADVERMSLEEYDRLFDEHGEPRPGVHYTGRGR